MNENEVKLSSFYNDKKFNYHSRTDSLRLLLMPFAFFALLGFPGTYGGYVSSYSNFVAPTLYILFGFFSLVPDKDKRFEKLKKGLVRASKIFAIMAVCCAVLSILYLAYINSLEKLLAPAFLRKRTLVNFLVLNVWPLPIGNGIWFIHSLVYAYLFFMLAEKIKLSKLYVPIFIVLTAIMLATGEFAGLLNFPYYEYPYIPAGAFTMAIPYMLVGMFIRKNVDYLSRIPRAVYIFLFFVGFCAAVTEIEVLRYIGKAVYAVHTVGYGVMALSLCCFTLAKPTVKDNFFSNHGKNYSRRMYALCYPVSFALWYIATLIKTEVAVVLLINCNGILTFFVCLALAFVIGSVKHGVRSRKEFEDPNWQPKWS